MFSIILIKHIFVSNRYLNGHERIGMIRKEQVSNMKQNLLSYTSMNKTSLSVIAGENSQTSQD